ncbi:MAG: nonstructural protein [Arizlama microvirus]|nr:MAG: nonstructural protein [Arizlama microvirus]
MKLLMFTVYDCKVERYLQPFFMQTKGQALRAWTDSVNDSNTNFHKHPEDFTLFEIGSYDDETGKVENHLTPISSGTAMEYINRGAK